MTRWTYESADCVTISHVSFLLRTLYRYTIPHRAFIHHTSQKRIKGKKKRKGEKEWKLTLAYNLSPCTSRLSVYPNKLRELVTTAKGGRGWWWFERGWERWHSRRWSNWYNWTVVSRGEKEEKRGGGGLTWWNSCTGYRRGSILHEQSGVISSGFGGGIKAWIRAYLLSYQIHMQQKYLYPKICISTISFDFAQLLPRMRRESKGKRWILTLLVEVLDNLGNTNENEQHGVKSRDEPSLCFTLLLDQRSCLRIDISWGCGINNSYFLHRGLGNTLRGEP